MKKKTFYLLLAVWIVALATFVTVLIVSFGGEDNDKDPGVVPPAVTNPSEESDSGSGSSGSDSQNGGDKEDGDEDGNWTGNY